jgi:hypothetical protein
MLPAAPASAVIKGTSSTLGSHVVRIHAGHVCPALRSRGG